jgi:hypothetical protein
LAGNAEKAPDRVAICDVKDLKVLSDALSDDQRLLIRLTSREIAQLKAELDQKTYWGPAASLPMVCLGPKCPVQATCSLQVMGKAPVGSPCPIELAMINRWKDDYLEALGASWENKLERQDIMDLVETEIMRSRANGIVASEGFVMENTIGMNPETGEPIKTKIKHIALEVTDQLSRRQERLRKSLLSTREMREKLGQGHGNQSQKESDLLDKVRKAIARERGGIIDAEAVGGKSKENAGSAKVKEEASTDSGASASAG